MSPGCLRSLSVGVATRAGSLARFQSTSAGAKAQLRVLPSFSLAEKVCPKPEMAHAFKDQQESEAKRAAAELVADACTSHDDMKPEDLNVVGIGCDVTSERAVQKAFESITGEFGRIDSVIASAGIVENYPALDYPFDRIQHLYDINVHGSFFTAREAARNMIAQGGGSIVLVASMSASIVNIPQPQTPYNASKAAVKHMASSLAVEWAKTGVRVNALSPGYMLTTLTKTILSDKRELKNTWENLTPMGRMGEPGDLAGAVVFLASDASRFVTGVELRVDGGYCLI